MAMEDYDLPPDPYLALGIAKSASLAEIKTAYRKLALKYHPDKIKDESLRSAGQERFQKIQNAYELLSDEARRAEYDEYARLVALHEKLKAERNAPKSQPQPQSQPQPTPTPTPASASKPKPSPTAYAYTFKSSRTYDARSDRVYEERKPRFFDEDAEYCAEPRGYDRTYSPPPPSQSGRKAYTRYPEEKKKTSTRRSEEPRRRDPSRERSTKYSSRDSRSTREKNRDKERRREFEEKYRPASYESDSDINYSRRMPSPEPRPRPKTRTGSTRKYSVPPETWEPSSKLDFLQDNAREYIHRTRSGNVYNMTPEPRPAPTPSPRRPSSSAYFDTPRRSSTSAGRSRSARDIPTATSASPPIIEPTFIRTHTRKAPNLNSTTSAPSNIKIPTPGLTRSATYHEPSLGSGGPKPPKYMKDIYDSGYSSSSPGTPKVFQPYYGPIPSQTASHSHSHSYSHSRSYSPPPPSRMNSKYTVVDENDDYRSAGLFDPTMRPRPTMPHRRSHSMTRGSTRDIPEIVPKSVRESMRNSGMNGGGPTPTTRPTYYSTGGGSSGVGVGGGTEYPIRSTNSSRPVPTMRTSQEKIYGY